MPSPVLLLSPAAAVAEEGEATGVDGAGDAQEDGFNEDADVLDLRPELFELLPG